MALPVFTCPECGAHEWGSSNCTGPGPLVRHCHGYTTEGRACQFSWPEADDLKYGVTPPDQTEGVGQTVSS